MTRRVLLMLLVVAIATPATAFAYQCAPLFFRGLEVGFANAGDGMAQVGRNVSLRLASGDCKHDTLVSVPADRIRVARSATGPFAPVVNPRVGVGRVSFTFSSPGVHYLRIDEGDARGTVPTSLVFMVRGPDDRAVRLRLPARTAGARIALVYVPSELRSEAARIAIPVPSHIEARAREDGVDPDSLEREARAWILPVIPLSRRPIQDVTLPVGHYEVRAIHTETTLTDDRGRRTIRFPGRFVQNRLGALWQELDVDATTTELTLAGPPS